MARKILLADDSVTAQNMGRKILADAGYEVITVNNGSAALKRIGEQRPDVIVLDVYMPGYSGLEVCQRLKEVGDTSRIPILLTVGKLEPFKPEEAKRVRADGYIVKPFEASELLSALTRLEDKIVPKNETSKAGRFARMATEDGRFDKSMAVEEDTSWKNRISFPSKKKDKEREPEPEEAVTSSDARDIRPAQLREATLAQQSEPKVDLAALATTGLPKDVTPEEIAALAAAAARMKGRAAEEQPPEPTSEMPVVAPPELSKTDEMMAAATPDTSLSTTADSVAETKETEAKVEAEPEQAESATMPAEVHPQAEAVTAALTPASQEVEEVASEPVTMAVAAAVGESSSRASRWTAVSVALAPEDEALSLEQEMQKAYSAFANAESVSSTSIPADFLNASGIAPLEAAVPATVAPEAVRPLSAMADAATEVVTAAVRELANVADAYAAERTDAIQTSSAEASEAQSAPVLEAEFQNVAPAVPVEEVLRSENHSETQSLKQEPVLDSPMPQVGAEPVPPTIIQETSSVPLTSGIGGSPDVSLPQQPPVNADTSEETAAMAATVGGSPVEEPSFDADPAIATIVDSVLANLRPKIVEEISRKLGKK